MKTKVHLFFGLLLLSFDSASAQGNAYGKNLVTICHNGNTIQVSPNAVMQHLAHGDLLGPCVANCIDPNQIDPNIACIQVYDPVCGCDGNTYPNSCYAINYGGVTSYTNGECGCIGLPALIFCLDYWDPVCGCNGVTYSNGCYAIQAGVTSYTPGPCEIIIFPRMSKDPTSLELSVIPNPSSNNPVIQWSIETEGNASLEIFDYSGKKISTLFSGMAEPGIIFDSLLQTENLARGIYIVRLSGTNFVRTEKLVLE